MDVTKLRRGDRMGDPTRGFRRRDHPSGQSLGGGDSGLGASAGSTAPPWRPGTSSGCTRTATTRNPDLRPGRTDAPPGPRSETRRRHGDAPDDDERRHTFQHEERMLDHGPVEALQIFLRPRAADLGTQGPVPRLRGGVEPRQVGLIAARGRAAGGPSPGMGLRRACCGQGSVVPAAASGPDAVRLLHVFGGDVEVGGLTLRAGDTAYLKGTAGGCWPAPTSTSSSS